MSGSLQIKNDRYYAVLYTKNEFGKSKQRWVSLGLDIKSPKKKVKETFNRILLENDILNSSVDTDVSFTEFCERWLNHIALKGKVCEITLQGYKTIVNKHFIPYFKKSKLKLKDITPNIIETYYENKMRDKPDKKGLSAKTIRGHQAVFSNIFNFALRENLVPFNPAKRVELPTLEKPKNDYYDDKEIKEVFNSIKNERLYPLFFLCVFYGLRRSEVLGLKWSDIDWARNTIHIQRSVSYNQSIVVKEGTKTKSSDRYYPINDMVKVLLNRVQQDQKKNKKLFGKEYIESDYIFTRQMGGLISPNTVSSVWRKILKKYNLRKVRIHDLRHSCASLLINEGYELKEISEWLGHSDISITANLYGHLFDKKKREMANSFSKFFIEEKNV